jgi:hypothetical protein
MSLADYEELKILELLVGKTAHSTPTVWVGLSTANPGENASGLAEPVAMGYARVITTGVWGTAANGTITNTTAITFAASSGSWGTITYFCLFDALTTGNMLAYGSLTQAKTVISGDTPKFDIGAITITID